MAAFTIRDRATWLENVNPATGEAYSLVARSTSEDDVQAAMLVEAAKKAFPNWSTHEDQGAVRPPPRCLSQGP